MSIANKRNNWVILFSKRLSVLLFFLVFSEVKSSHPSYGAISDKAIPSYFILEANQEDNEALKADQNSDLIPLLPFKESLPIKNGLASNINCTIFDNCKSEKHVHFDIQTEIKNLDLLNRLRKERINNSSARINAAIRRRRDEASRQEDMRKCMLLSGCCYCFSTAILFGMI